MDLKKLFGKDSKHILLLTYNQLNDQKPLYKLPSYIEETYLKELLDIDKLVDKSLYKSLDNLEEIDFRSIERHIFRELSKELEENTALIVDVTDTYFAGSKADWKSKKGKDGKVGKLLQIALAVTKEHGIPIMHKCYEGNIGNVKIFQYFLADIYMSDFSLILVDRGMCSIENITEINRLGYKVIFGLRMNKTVQNNSKNYS